MNSVLPVTDPPVDAGLPSYETTDEHTNPPTYSHVRPQTITRERAEHVYHLMNSKGQPWATFGFHTTARSPQNTPVVFEGDTIAGTFELDVNKEHVMEIAVVVGYLLTLYIV
jgi:hypothetical protein